jgi:hypothetical protein
MTAMVITTVLPSASMPKVIATISDGIAEMNMGVCHKAFNVWTEFTVSTGKKVSPRRNAIEHTHARFPSREQAWEPMASPSAISRRKTRTVHLGQMMLHPVGVTTKVHSTPRW